MGGACRTNGRDEKCKHNFGQKIERKIQLGIPRRGLEDYIKMDLTEIGWHGVDWMHPA